MRLLLAALLCLLAGCGGGSIPEAQAAERRQIAVVIGDSITAGYIPTGGVLQLRQDFSYTAELSKSMDVVTAAAAGASTQAALLNQVYWLKSVPADYLVIMLGTNDAVLGLDRGQSLANVAKIAEAWPKSKVILVSPPYWDAQADAWLSPWSADLKTMANSKGWGFVDAYAVSKDWICHPTDKHPCAPGHKSLAALVAGAMK